MDLSNLSRHYGLEVIGVLGFPALRPFIITIDYRNRLVKIEPKLPASLREAHRSVPENSPTPRHSTNRYFFFGPGLKDEQIYARLRRVSQWREGTILGPLGTWPALPGAN